MGNGLRVAIPKEILRAIGVQKGDTLLMTTTDSQTLTQSGGYTTETAKKKGLARITPNLDCFLGPKNGGYT